MNFGGATIRVLTSRIYGYQFRLITEPHKREAFMQALKTTVPMKMWDLQSKRWWVPDIYTAIVESIALEHGAITHADREVIAGGRAKYETVTPTLDGDFALLGCVPGVPIRLVEMAFAYWKTSLHGISVSTLDLQAKEEAWARIQEHFRQAALKPLVLESTNVPDPVKPL